MKRSLKNATFESKKMTSHVFPAHILCVHQGYELYGSDRTFISSLMALKERYPDTSISVILPRTGDLARTLSELGFRVTIDEVWVLRKANGIWYNLGRLLALPLDVMRAMRRLQGCNLAYINTSVIFDYAIASRFCSCATILHIHEIPTGIAMHLIRAVVGITTADLVYNSAATKRAFGFSGRRREFVLHNGISYRPAAMPRQPFSGNIGQMHVLMIGRINSWKGQDLLIEAVAALPAPQRERLSIKFAGAAFEEGPETLQLATKITKAALNDRVILEGFVKDPSDLYQWADIVVVPSKRPEPFGLVAVEAMAHGRPVLAADHGGLQEIVLHEKTGLLFEPGNAAALARTLQLALENPTKMQVLGSHGHDRYVEGFTEDQYKENFLHVIETVLKRRSDRCAPLASDHAGVA
jgi:glycosyltransferase involved in cell wall biosynthesis